MYRGFRHVVRNVHTFQLHAERVAALAGSITACFNKVQQDLSDFTLHLEEIGQQ